MTTGTPMSQAFISVEGLTRRFPDAAGGGQLTVFEDLWFTVAEGEFACMVGHSGCGKSTILNILAGLDTPTEGHIVAAGKHVIGPSLDRAVIFQGHALMPWLSALGNVELAVSSRHPRWSKRQIREHALKYLALVHLDGSEMKKPAAALGRHEAARRHRSRARHRAAHAADGRAVLGARCADARLAAGRGDRYPRQVAPDHLHDHARRRRGAAAGRQDPADDQRSQGAHRRDRREHAAEGAHARRAAQAAELLSPAQSSDRVPGHALARAGAAPSPARKPAATLPSSVQQPASTPMRRRPLLPNRPSKPRLSISRPVGFRRRKLGGAGRRAVRSTAAALDRRRPAAASSHSTPQSKEEYLCDAKSSPRRSSTSSARRAGAGSRSPTRSAACRRCWWWARCSGR